jgi:hypothetical protein
MCMRGNCEGSCRVGWVADGDINAIWVVFKAAEKEVVERAPEEEAKRGYTDDVSSEW